MSTISAPPSRRPQGSLLGTLALVVVAVALAGLVGVIAGGGGTTVVVVAGAIVAVCLGALLARAPAFVLSLALLAMCYSPEYLGASAGVFGHPQLQKGLVYFAVLGVALQRGMRPRLLIVVAGYVVQALLAWLWGDLMSGLTLTQVLSSFVTLSVGWTALAIKWDFERDLVYLKVLSCIPVACLALGLVLQAAGLHTFFAHGTGFDSSTRLQGASIPAQLALTSFVAVATSAMCYRITRWRPAGVLVVANALILALTVSRGAAIAVAIAMAWPIMRFALGRIEPQDRIRARWMRLGIVGVIIAGAAAFALPALLNRASTGTFIQGQGVVYDKTSGRSAAWSQFYAIAKRSPLFGHGLGSGPITKIVEKGFTAQHNEYLRLFLEGGYIGGGIVVAAMIIVIGVSIVNAPPTVRLDLLGLVAGFAVLSWTDNTFTSVNIQVPFCLVFGLLGSWGMARPRPRWTDGPAPAPPPEAPLPPELEPEPEPEPVPA